MIDAPATDNPSGIRARMRHVRMTKLCGPGVPVWHARFDRDLLHRFCREGLPVELLESMDDAFAQRVAAVARKEATDGR